MWIGICDYVFQRIIYVLETHTEILVTKWYHACLEFVSREFFGGLGVRWRCGWSRTCHELAIPELCDGSCRFIIFFLSLCTCLKICPVEFEEKATNEILASSNPLPLSSVGFFVVVDFFCVSWRHFQKGIIGIRKERQRKHKEKD